MSQPTPSAVALLDEVQREMDAAITCLMDSNPPFNSLPWEAMRRLQHNVAKVKAVLAHLAETPAPVPHREGDPNGDMCEVREREIDRTAVSEVWQSEESRQLAPAPATAPPLDLTPYKDAIGEGRGAIQMKDGAALALILEIERLRHRLAAAPPLHEQIKDAIDNPFSILRFDTAAPPRETQAPPAEKEKL